MNIWVVATTHFGEYSF